MSSCRRSPFFTRSMSGSPVPTFSSLTTAGMHQPQNLNTWRRSVICTLAKHLETQTVQLKINLGRAGIFRIWWHVFSFERCMCKPLMCSFCATIHQWFIQLHARIRDVQMKYFLVILMGVNESGCDCKGLSAPKDGGPF